MNKKRPPEAARFLVGLLPKIILLILLGIVAVFLLPLYWLGWLLGCNPGCCGRRHGGGQHDFGF